MLQGVAGVCHGPVLFFIVLVFTLPPAIICTVMTLILVGPRRGKLAWLSLCVFALPFLVAIGRALFAAATKAH